MTDTGEGPHNAVSTPDIDRKMHEQEEARGMGMFLIQALVDEAEWGERGRPPGAMRAW